MWTEHGGVLGAELVVKADKTGGVELANVAFAAMQLRLEDMSWVRGDFLAVSVARKADVVEDHDVLTAAVVAVHVLVSQVKLEVSKSSLFHGQNGHCVSVVLKDPGRHFSHSRTIRYFGVQNSTNVEICVRGRGC